MPPSAVPSRQACGRSHRPALQAPPPVAAVARRGVAALPSRRNRAGAWPAAPSTLPKAAPCARRGRWAPHSNRRRRRSDGGGPAARAARQVSAPPAEAGCPRRSRRCPPPTRCPPGAVAPAVPPPRRRERVSSRRAGDSRARPSARPEAAPEPLRPLTLPMASGHEAQTGWRLSPKSAPWCPARCPPKWWRPTMTA